MGDETELTPEEETAMKAYLPDGTAVGTVVLKDGKFTIELAFDGNAITEEMSTRLQALTVVYMSTDQINQVVGEN